MPEYSNLHRTTLQSLMGYGSIRKKEFDEIFHKICQKYGEKILVDDVIAAINQKISTFDQKISKLNFGLTDDDYYVFHSTSETSMSSVQNSYNEADLEFFKAMFHTVVSDQNARIPPREALNLSSGIVGKITKVRAQKLLDKWISCAYFYLNQQDNHIYIGPKLIIEYQELLQSLELRHIKSCLLCESLAIWGDRCNNCSTIYHTTCIRKFLIRSDKCPSCKEKWRINEEN